MDRPDLSHELVHFIRGDTSIQAFATLQLILSERRLLGGDGFIKGRYKCVCFCEAPIAFVAAAMQKRRPTGIRYQPFGVVLPKTWLYERGGRPAIYQSDSEFSQLPEVMRWRHVRYEPTADPPIDFTWEREWRVRADEVPLDPEVTRIVVPDQEHATLLMERHREEQNLDVMHWSAVIGSLAELYREEFPWTVQALQELCVTPPSAAMS